MPPRTLTFVILTVLIAFGSPASAKDKNKSSKRKITRSWMTVAEHVLKNGSEHPIKAPASRTLGFDSDEVPAKVLRVKLSASKDKKEHSVSVTYKTDVKGNLTPLEIILGTILVETAPSGKMIDSYRLRINPDGTIITAIHTAGIAGEAEQKVLASDSAEAVAVFKSESSLHLETNTLDQLTR